MHTLSKSLIQSLIAVLAAAFITIPSFAQSPAASLAPAASPSGAPTTSSTSTAPTTGQMSAADMQKMMVQMMELAKPGENHKLLAGLAGSWTYTVKMWMNPADPNAKPETSKGTATRKAALDGHYFLVEVNGKMQMPGPDGKPKDMDFKGMSIEAYNNVSKKFEATWCDNMGTGIFMSQGTYDPATKTFTYTGEMEAIPGMKTKVRETVKVIDNDHHMFEWYEDRGGQEVKTLEIAYTRKK
jgi:hypothetical protein